MSKLKNTITLQDTRRVVCKVYDSGSQDLDRYTVVFKAIRYRDRLSYSYLASSQTGHQSGFCESATALNKDSCGKQIPFDALPPPVKNMALSYFKRKTLKDKYVSTLR